MKKIKVFTNNYISKFTFYYLNKLINFGISNEFNYNNLPNIDTDLDYYIQKEKFNKYLIKNKKRTFKTNLLYYLFPNWIIFLFGFLLASILNATLPFLLKLFIDSFVNRSLYNSLLYGSLLFIILISKPFVSQNASLFGFKATNKMFSIMSSIIAEKIKKLNNNSKNNINIGILTSFLTVDIQRIILSILTFHLIFISPILIILFVFIISLEIGIYSLITPAWIIVSCLFLFILIIPIKRYSNDKLLFGDKRGKFINEILEGIKIIKMNAWELIMKNKIFDIRKKEAKVIKFINFIKQFQDGVLNILPSFFGFVVISVYFLNVNRLNTSSIFYLVLVFNLFINPLKFLFIGLIQFFEANNALNRLNDFFYLEEIKEDEWKIFNKNFQKNNMNNGEIEIEGLFTYQNIINNQNLKKHEKKNFNDKISSTQNLNLISNNYISIDKINIKKGEFYALIGKVGSGKSSFLKIILKELNSVNNNSYSNFKGSISYVPQESFLINDTFRNNILFGNKYIKDKYQEILNLCDLNPDIKLLNNKDLTEIGERGINLSGGQKQRISIARSIYKESDIYLIDDALSAWDNDISQKIFNNVIINYLKNKNKTIIMATHSIQYLKQIDKIIILENGSIQNKGTYDYLINNDKKFKEFLSNHVNIKKEESKPKPKVKINKITRNNIKRKSIIVSQMDNNDMGINLLHMDNTKHNNIQLNIFKDYIKNGNIFYFILFCLLTFIFSLIKIFGDYWITAWSTNIFRLTNNQYFLYYGIIILTLVLIKLISSFIYGLFTSKVSYNIFSNLLNKIIKKNLFFFNTTQIGEILNLTNKDIDYVDVGIPDFFAQLISLGLNLLGTIIFIFVNNVLIIPFYIVGLTIMIYWVLKYLKVSTKLRKISQEIYSPMISNITEFYNGYSTFKVYDKINYQLKKFNDKSKTAIKILFLERLCGIWINFRLELIISLLIGSFIYILILGFFLNLSFFLNNIDLIGLSLSYSILIITYINVFLFYSAETIKGMSSVDRIINNIDDLNLETNLNEPKPSKINWLENNNINIKKLNVKYSKNQKLVLKNIILSFKNNEKIGLVGRSGSGKSTFILSLMRMLYNTGEIIIDDLDIETIGLHHLRKNLLWIPQDPFIIQGNLRENVDIENKFTDEDITNALKDVFEDSLEKFKYDENGNNINLWDYKIKSNGKNLSFGERQLLNISRILLGKKRVLLMDEATSNIDFDLDKKIQNLIKKKFNDCLVITIAHRINTIINYDKIVFLKEGEVIEIGEPKKLLNDSKSHFYNLVLENGYDYLKKLKNNINN